MAKCKSFYIPPDYDPCEKILKIKQSNDWCLIELAENIGDYIKKKSGFDFI